MCRAVTLVEHTCDLENMCATAARGYEEDKKDLGTALAKGALKVAQTTLSSRVAAGAHFVRGVMMIRRPALMRLWAT
jgi:hypothetical protein